jgi:hypothetical protein
MKPRHTDARSTRILRRTGSGADDASDYLVSWNHVWQLWRKLAFDDMQVSATHPAGCYPNQDFTAFRLRSGNVLQPEWVSGNSAGIVEHHRFHQRAFAEIDNRDF